MSIFLIVDDNDRNLYLLKALLQGHGHRVISATNGAEALEVGRSDPPDMVISDILMPVMDGFTLCREWRKDDQLREIPFIFYTATYTDPKDEEFALSLGGDRFIVKPVDPAVIMTVIEEVLNDAGRAKRQPESKRLEEEEVFKLYSERLVHKLEKKMLDLEREVAERKRAEDALRKNERIYRETIEAARGVPYKLRFGQRCGTGTYEFIGDGAEALLGVSKEDLTHERFCALIEETIFNDPSVAMEPETFHGIFLRGKIARLQADLRIVTPRGEEKWLSDCSIPLRDEHTGEIVGSIGILHDISDRRKLEDQLRQAQKMEAVGNLAGGVAHDFNNLLLAIQGYTDLILIEEPTLSESLRDNLQQVQAATHRAAMLTNQLLAFSRQQVISPVDLNLNDIIADLMKMLRRLIGEDIELDIRSTANLGYIHVDRTQMEQVLMNLCVNARDAMPEGGRITIKTENVRLDKSLCTAPSWATGGQFVLLSITDTGCGMDEKTLSMAFEPFFTTKEVGKGTGLGLSTVYGIVTQHGGRIEAKSELGVGTTFNIYMPAVECREDLQSAKPASPVPGGTETILVAEDEEVVRRLTTHVLERAGYRVLVAKDGEEAVHLFEAHADEISLALLDVVMPKMGGRAVRDRIRTLRPALRFLFTSGYSSDAVNSGFVVDEGLRLLQKPYSTDSLLRCMREVLDA